MTRTEVEAQLQGGETLENLDLSDLDLSGLSVEGRSFRGSDIRSLALYAEGAITNIKRTDWTDAIIAGYGNETFFGRVEAEGARFGCSESLVARRKRQEGSGPVPLEDSGALLNFNGAQGRFTNTRWSNLDFGGGSRYEAIFSGADLRGAEIDGCDLSMIDFSETLLDGVIIKDPVALRGLRVDERHVSDLADGLRWSEEQTGREFSDARKKFGDKKALEEMFGVVFERVASE